MKEERKSEKEAGDEGKSEKMGMDNFLEHEGKERRVLNRRKE